MDTDEEKGMIMEAQYYAAMMQNNGENCEKLI